MRLRWPRLTPEVRRLLRLMLPVAFGAGVYQINVLIDTMIASLLPSGAISYLYYADRVNQLPLGVIGIAVATALLPLMSRQIRAGDEADALASQNRALEFAAFLTLPAAFAMVVAAGPIISGLFGRGQFGAGAQSATALALAAFAIGLPAHVGGQGAGDRVLRARGHRDPGPGGRRRAGAQRRPQSRADLASRPCRDRARDLDLVLGQRRVSRSGCCAPPRPHRARQAAQAQRCRAWCCPHW